MKLGVTSMCLVCLALFPVSVSAGQTPSPGGTVSLRFDWPEDIGIGVSFASRQVREQPDGSTDMRSEGHYSIEVTAHPRGLLVDQSAMEATLFESVPSLPPPVEAVYRNLLSLSPDYVVSREGELLGVERPDELIASFRSSMEPILALVPPEAAGIQALVDQCKRPFLTGLT